MSKTMKKFAAILLVVFLLVLGIFIFNKNKTETNDTNKIKVSASFYPLYFFASQIGGDKADVKNITPAGAEPHDYDPSTQDIARIEDGKMLILNGGVEAWGNKVKENLQDRDVKVITAGEGLLTKQLEEDGATMKDPHIWLNPELAKKEAQKITAGYIAIDPANTSYYQENEKQLDAKLDQLNEEYKQGLSSCKSRDIVTSHAAFAYLAEQYGLHQVAISGLSPDAEPSAQQLVDVANFVKQNDITYIFFESLVSPKLSETIANETDAKTLVLDPLEGLSDDEIKQGKDYFSVMKNNLKNLQIALQCNTE
jgi:zinc transport system substrate-binding protein